MYNVEDVKTEMFIDGHSIGTGGGFDNYVAGKQFCLGRGAAAEYRAFNGILADFRVYKGVLLIEQINRIGVRESNSNLIMQKLMME